MNDDLSFGTIRPDARCLSMASYNPPHGPSDQRRKSGGVVMSDDEAFSLRERLRAVEVQIGFLRKDFDGMRDEMKDEMKAVAASIGALTDLVSQAKGARWAFVAFIAAIGAGATYIPTIIKLIITAAK